MSVATVYTCNRDGTEGSSPDGEPPAGWMTVNTQVGDEESGRTKLRHLCPDCKPFMGALFRGEAVPPLSG